MLSQLLRVMNSQTRVVLEGSTRWIVVVNLEHVIFLLSAEWNADVLRKILRWTANAPRSNWRDAGIPIVGWEDVRVIWVANNALRLCPQIEVSCVFFESSLSALEQRHVMNSALLRQDVFRENRLEADDVMFLLEVWAFEDLTPVNRVVAFVDRHLRITFQLTCSPNNRKQTTYIFNCRIPMLDIWVVALFLEWRVEQVYRLNSLRFELDFVEMRWDNVALSVAPKHLHRVRFERNVSWIARFERSLKHNDGVSQILISLALYDVILRIVFENLFEVRIFPMTVLKNDWTFTLVNCLCSSSIKSKGRARRKRSSCHLDV